MLVSNNNEITDITIALRDLDERIQGLGLTIWIGGEPTFTDRFSAAPEWISNALGGDKETRAENLARYLATAFPGCILLRTVGRQYPNELLPRWNLGLLNWRNGAELWHGPPDPSLSYEINLIAADLNKFRQDLINELQKQGWSAIAINSSNIPTLRVLTRWDGKEIFLNQLSPKQLYRSSIHTQVIPDGGLVDNLVGDGWALLILDIFTNANGESLSVELPEITDITIYLQLLTVIATTAVHLNLPAIVLRGYPPPIDQRLLWTTITPDPAVIEINQAPAATLVEQFQSNQAIFHAASQCGLFPYRLHYNGRESDSGGGGQLTIGGPTPEASPFFLQPKLLPRLIRYFNHHPSLSYWLAMESLGSGSQAPRPDEGPRERWLELTVALEQLEQHAITDPVFLWASLAPLLVDAAGNSHRTELNIEKLMNPHLKKSQLGLVELRPLRMAPDAETFSATAALLRAIIARLARYSFEHPLIDWGDRLHGQFALPYYLHLDLQFVLADLAAYGLGLGNFLTDLLLHDARYEIGNVEWHGVNIRVLSALEFWPLIGDATAQPRSDSRLIDASTTRIELRLTALHDDNLEHWKLRINGFTAHLNPALNNSIIRLAGIRYRSFTPFVGLHPKMPAVDRINLILEPPNSTTALELTVFEWRPQGGAYSGLPENLMEARNRRRERLVVSEFSAATLPAAKLMPAHAVNNFCFDMRRVYEQS